MAIIKAKSGTLTLGASGQSVVLASGASMSGQNYPAFEARSTSAFSISNNTETKVQYAVEDFDTDNCYDTSTYRFTPNIAGKYFVYARFTYDSDADFDDIRLTIKKNTTTVADCLKSNSYYNILNNYVTIDLNGTTDYVEVYTRQTSGGSLNSLSNNSGTRNAFGAYRIGD